MMMPTAEAPAQGLEAAYEQLANLRKDLAAREERMARRVESERKERQTAILELKRDLAKQQTGDLDAQEARILRRLEGDRREHRASLTEIRRDLSMQQEQRCQIASLRRDISSVQAALVKSAHCAPTGAAEEAASPWRPAAAPPEPADEGVVDRPGAERLAFGDLRDRLALLEDGLARLQREVSSAAAPPQQQVEEALQEARLGIDRLGRDFEQERSDRCGSLAEVRRALRAVEEAQQRTERRLAEILESPPAALGGARAQPLSEVLGSSEHVALAACVGELDAELRVELAALIDSKMKGIQREVNEQLRSSKVELHEDVADWRSQLGALSSRVVKLEEARLDHRIGVLETAQQHSAIYGARPILEEGTVTIASVGEPACDLGILRTSSVANLHDSFLAAHEQEVSPPAPAPTVPAGAGPSGLAGGARPGSADCRGGRGGASSVTESAGTSSAVAAAWVQELDVSCSCSMASAPRPSAEDPAQAALPLGGGDPQGSCSELPTARQPPKVADTLKERLAGLVDQVRETLHQADFSKKAGARETPFDSPKKETAARSPPAAPGPGASASLVPAGPVHAAPAATAAPQDVLPGLGRPSWAAVVPVAAAPHAVLRAEIIHAPRRVMSPLRGASPVRRATSPLRCCPPLAASALLPAPPVSLLVGGGPSPSPARSTAALPAGMPRAQ